MTRISFNASTVASSPRALTGLAGAARYEYRMHLRRPAVWIVELTLIGLVFLGAGPRHPMHLGADTPVAALIGGWALTFNLLLPLGVGILLADRGRRERRLGIDELLDATPTGRGLRWWGKALGVTAAAATPIACAWVVLLTVVAISRGPAVVPLGIAAFAGVILPGLMFVAAFSLAVPLVTGPALFRVLFIGYWFWGNLLSPSFAIPTLSGTIIEPLGEYASAGWFGGMTLTATERGVEPDGMLAAASVAVLLATSVGVLLLAHVTRARRSRP